VLADAVPLLFFGRVLTARVATVGTNPSWREFQDGRGQPVSPSRVYFPSTRYQDGDLPIPDALKICQSLHWYFERHPFRWFDWPEALLNGMGVSFRNGTAVHTDIESPLATHPNWRGLRHEERVHLSADGRMFWKSLILQMPELRAIVGLGTDSSIVESMGVCFDEAIDLSSLHLPPIRLGSWTHGGRRLTIYWWEQTWGQPRAFFRKDGKSLYPAIGRCLMRRRPWDGGRGDLPPVQKSPTWTSSFVNPCREKSEMHEILGDEQTLLEKLDASPRDRDLLLGLLKIEETSDYPSADRLAAEFVRRFREDEKATTLGEPRNDRRPKVWARASIVAEHDDGTPEEMKVKVMEDTTRGGALRFAEAVLRGEPRLRSVTHLSPLAPQAPRGRSFLPATSRPAQRDGGYAVFERCS